MTIDRDLFNDAKDTVEGRPPFRMKNAGAGKAIASLVREKIAEKQMKTVALNAAEVQSLQSSGSVEVWREMEPQPKLVAQGARLIAAGISGIWYWKGSPFSTSGAPMLNPLGQPGDVLGVSEDCIACKRGERPTWKEMLATLMRKALNMRIVINSVKVEQKENKWWFVYDCRKEES